MGELPNSVVIAAGSGEWRMASSSHEIGFLTMLVQHIFWHVFIILKESISRLDVIFQLDHPSIKHQPWTRNSCFTRGRERDEISASFCLNVALAKSESALLSRVSCAVGLWDVGSGGCEPRPCPWRHEVEAMGSCWLIWLFILELMEWVSLKSATQDMGYRHTSSGFCV